MKTIGLSQCKYQIFWASLFGVGSKQVNGSLVVVHQFGARHRENKLSKYHFVARSEFASILPIVVKLMRLNLMALGTVPNVS